MRIECAWCGEIMKDEKTKKVSHGICEKCYKKFKKQIEEARNENK